MLRTKLNDAAAVLTEWLRQGALGHQEKIADYCKSDVINTYRLWLRHELFRGRLDRNQFVFSDENVSAFI
jgi:3'-5' exonuclease